MPIANTNFGNLSYEEHQVLQVKGGLIGVPSARSFVLLEAPEIEPLKWLVTTEGPEFVLLVIDPRLLVADYFIRLDEGERQRLEVTAETAILPLAIAKVSENPHNSTANLKAPILVNTDRMLAIQVVPVECEYSVAYPLLSGSLS